MKKHFILMLMALLLKIEVQAQPFTRDTSFELDINFFAPGSSCSITDLIEVADNKLLVTGEFVGALNYQRGMVRFFSNGQPDPSFQVPNNLNMNLTYHVVPTDYGYWVMYDLDYVAKLNHNGQRIDADYTYNLQWTDLTYCPFSRPIIFNDGSLLIGGYECGYPDTNPYRWMNLMRVLPDGHIDTTFQHNANGSILHLLRYDSTKILAAGFFQSYDSVPITNLCRIDTLGNLDSTFQSIFTYGLVYPIHVQPDGKIIVRGTFTIQNYPETLGLVRLHPDGSLDSTFNNFNNIDAAEDNIFTICPTSDGGYLVGGDFTSYQGVQKGRIVKTDANGFIEPQYFTGTGIDTPPPVGPYFRVNTITKGSNDQYYIMGPFSGFNGETVQPIIRLNGPQTVGIEPEVAKKAAVSVQPNPARDRVTVILPAEAPISGPCSLHITDLAGREITSAKFTGASTSVDVSYLPHGLYLLTVTTNNGQTWQQKLVVQH